MNLKELFNLQEEFMSLLHQEGKLPEFPVDLSSKKGQAVVKSCMFSTVEELMEASFTLKNKQHRISDVKEFDRPHYVEEIGDAFAFLMETCILSDISADELCAEFVRKNQVVKQRLEEGY